MTFNFLSKNILMLSILLLLCSKVGAETKDQQIKVVLRTIGHEFLLQLNDSTSRVLPIERKDGRYALRFESKFAFEPGLLVSTTDAVLARNQVTDSFIVEVEQCETGALVHSFQAGRRKVGNMAPCRERALPADCYIIYFTAIGVKQETANLSTNYFKLNYLFVIGILGFCLIGYFFMRRRVHQLKPDVINIGQYQFDQKGMHLIYETQSIELSSKESDLLFLLFSNENKTLKREYILKMVWGDEGNYVGRTLDVFISKLRKKLESDSNLKIINIRGIGYRFVIN